MSYYTYILASKRNGTLYVGVTNNLIRRTYEHKHHLADGFTKQHRVHILVYYEIHTEIEHAIRREKLIKKWRRQMKRETIEASNPEWDDLYDTLF